MSAKTNIEAHSREVGDRTLKARVTNFGIDLFLGLFGLLMILPLVLLVANAFKTPEELLSWPPSVIPAQPTLGNIEAVLADTPLLRWIFNSFSFALLSALAILVTSTIAGYILAKFPSRAMSVMAPAYLPSST